MLSSRCLPLDRPSELDLLYRVATTLAAPGDLPAKLDAVLADLAADGMQRGMVTILDESANGTTIEACHGLSVAQRSRGRYRVGEGVIGAVLERGEPAIVSSLDQEPRFLDRTCSRRDLDWSRISFICVPIISGNERLGTISVDRTSPEVRHLDQDVRILTVVATLLGGWVKTYRDHRDEIASLQREKALLEEQLHADAAPAFMVGNSPEIRQVFRQVAQVARTDTTVLIRGESGTGKELVARAIHEKSARHRGPFVSVNCAALPEQLVASELFGHVRGAYTGASASRRGRFELAEGGTIFLDEIGEVTPAIQVKLLRVLQEGEIDRLGDERTRKIDVRVIAATNANLERAIERAEFRQDLYYRLDVFPIYLPPLRERTSDVTLLADHFLEKYSRLHGRNVRRISTPAIQTLTSYHWPGNVRELENCMARAVLLASEGVVRTHHLPPTLQTARSSGTAQQGSLESMLMAYEREILLEALKECGGNKAEAARRLQTTPRIFAYRLRRHTDES